MHISTKLLQKQYEEYKIYTESLKFEATILHKYKIT